MSEEQMTELETLKSLADDMGLKYHPSIGAEALRLKISEADEATAEDVEEETAPVVEAPVSRAALKAQATKLVRIRIACMNPAKREWEGEMFCTGNRFIGTLKKYVPFDTEWHVPQAILDMIQERQCQVFVNKKIRMESGMTTTMKEGKLIREFAVEILPALTKEELASLAQRQAMAAGTAAG